MKERGNSRNFESGRVPGIASSNFKPKFKARKKLGGGGLTLEAFVEAKSKPAINPAQIREQREFYQNAKKVNKYKKLLKQLNQQNEGSRVEPPDRVEDGVGIAAEGSQSHRKSGAVRKPQFIKGNQSLQFKMQRKKEKREREDRRPTQVEKLREEVELKKQEEEKEREVRVEKYAVEKEAREKVLRQRKAVQNKMRKKTGRGQPVLKHRLEQLLETLQKG